MEMSELEQQELEILLAVQDGRLSQEEGQEAISLLQSGRDISVDDGIPVVNERTPEVSVMDRALFQNFGADTDEGFNYLQKEYPDLNFKKDKDGEVLVKRPEDEAWRMLDPQATWYNPLTYEAEDVSDVLYDVPAGAIEAVATGLGGIGGGALGLLGGVYAPVTVPAGALVGAGMTGGATSAGLEGLRQTMGRGLGMRDEYDTEKIKDAGVWGAATSLLGPGGKVTKGIGKGIVDKYAKDAAQKEMIQQGQRSLIGRGLSSGAETLSSGFANVPKDVMRYGKANVKKIQDAQKLAEERGINLAAADLVEDLRFNKIEPVMETKKIQAQQGIATAIDNVPEEVLIDTKKAFAPFDELYKKYEKGYLDELNQLRRTVGQEAADEAIQNRQSYRDFKAIKETYNSIKPIEPSVTAQSALAVKERLNRLSKISQRPDAAGETSGIAQDLVNASRRTAKQIDEGVKTHPDIGAEVKNAYKNYAEYKSLEKRVHDNFGKVGRPDLEDQAAKKTEDALTKMLGSGKQTQKRIYNEIGKDLGIDMKQEAVEAGALKVYTDPSLFPHSGGGITSTSRTIGSQTLGEGAAGIAAVNLPIPDKNKYEAIMALRPIGGVASMMGLSPAGQWGKYRAQDYLRRRGENLGDMYENIPSPLRLPLDATLQNTSPTQLGVRTWQRIDRSEDK
jgi:hypothetical protein